MKNFGKGFFLGILTAAGAVAGSLYAFKKTVDNPIDEHKAVLEEQKKRALRKSMSAHQG